MNSRSHEIGTRTGFQIKHSLIWKEFPMSEHFDQKGIENSTEPEYFEKIGSELRFSDLRGSKFKKEREHAVHENDLGKKDRELTNGS